MIVKNGTADQNLSEPAAATGTPLAGAACFIERQFPVARVSAESYKERKANYSQTLTGLGKWWGRKPLVLVRATILGLLMPASNDPKRDREVFLKLMTMDEGGLLQRKEKKLEDTVLYEFAADSERKRFFQPDPPTWRTDPEIAWEQLSPAERQELFESEPDPEKSAVRQGPRKKDTQERERQIRRRSRETKEELEKQIFPRLPYSRKLRYCCRPEHLDGPSKEAWDAINSHLGTDAHSLAELVAALGQRRFGHRPRVGDSFCGAGSVPFEAARIGCDAYASDLSPVAVLLTWAALNIVGGGEEVAAQVAEAQREIFDAVDRQVTEWGIEHNEYGWRADAYLYCVEVTCPECAWRVPLAPSWVVGEKTRTVAELVPDEAGQRFEIEIHEGVSDERLARAKDAGTVKDSRLWCPHCGQDTPIDVIRRKGDSGRSIAPRPTSESRTGSAPDSYHESGLRLWDNEDLVPRPDDVFQERLYCIRWVLPDLEDALCLEQEPGHSFGRELQYQWNLNPRAVVDGLVDILEQDDRETVAAARQATWPAAAAAILSAKMQLKHLPEDADSGARLEAVRALGQARKLLPKDVVPIVEASKRMPGRTYRAPTVHDFRREHRVLGLVQDRFREWQEKGYIPSRRIEPGAKTTEPIRTRGWTHWHHLFTPRQLLMHGLVLGTGSTPQDGLQKSLVAVLLAGAISNRDSRMVGWVPSYGVETTDQVFTNQALNTKWNWGARGTVGFTTVLTTNTTESVSAFREARPADARWVASDNDFWLTDPPYADAVNYHELSEFFLAWYEKHLPRLFPDWYTDSKRALAVKADDPVEFRQSMVACYRRLVEHMPDDGLQVVMFTHQDAGVWADLTMILWAAGLRVTAAWCIATETDSAIKEGNYVQGTVLLVCRKRTDAEPVFLDEVNHRVETEVRRQLDDMTSLEDSSEPNFADADYQLAAYAAALRVLTERPIDEIDPEREIARVRPRGETSPVEQLIRNAVKIACDHLVPKGIEREMWKTLAPLERFYLKGLEVEMHGEHRSGVFQELARGFGAADYTDLLATSKANQARLRTAGEFGKRMLSGDGFASSLVRQVLFAVHQITRADEAASGLNWLKTELPEYWNSRDKIMHILDFLATVDKVAGLDHWARDSEAARLLAGAVRNDHV